MVEGKLPVVLVKWYDYTNWLLDRIDALPKNQREAVSRKAAKPQRTEHKGGRISFFFASLRLCVSPIPGRLQARFVPGRVPP
jgi:hypothetical protein